MKVSIFGLGYVGAVSAACLAECGHHVIGVDKSLTKIDMINRGQSPVVEKGLGELIAAAQRRGLLVAMTDAKHAVHDTELSLICVGTPSQKNGAPDISHIEDVCRDIGAALASKHNFHVVVMRSTLLPGTMEARVIPLLEQASGRKAGVDFGVCYNPEFMREGSAIEDFLRPAHTIIGATDAKSEALLRQLYEGLPAPVVCCPLAEAGMLKFADNAWHAVKVVFANEIGRLCKAQGIDSHAVMKMFCQDTKLNISPAYLMPGFAFGGSCLPKDVRALIHSAEASELSVPLLGATLASNRVQIDAGVEMILATRQKKIAILGISFKAGTDDMRESPLIEVARVLLGKGLDVRLCDSNVNIAALVGANREYVLNTLPDIERLMTHSIDEALAHAQVVVIGNNAPEFSTIAGKLRAEQHVIDFVRIPTLEHSHEHYQGISW